MTGCWPRSQIIRSNHLGGAGSVAGELGENRRGQGVGHQNGCRKSDFVRALFTRGDSDADSIALGDGNGVCQFRHRQCFQILFGRLRRVAEARPSGAP